MGSCAVKMMIKTKVSLILALSSLMNCDKFCENEEGDLIWIKYAHVDYKIDNPKGSLVDDDSLVDHLEVDDHEYTYQITPPYLTNDTKGDFILFYKNGYKNGDKIKFDKTILLNLIENSGFKDIKFLRRFGYQYRTKPPPVNRLGLDSKALCYHYECQASVINENCNPTLNTPESKCTLTDKVEKDPDIGYLDGIPSKFAGQCIVSLDPVAGNIFSIWLGSAWNKNKKIKLPTIEVLANTVNFNWGEAATKFPEGTIF